MPSNRDRAEQSLTRVVETSTKSYLRRVIEEVVSALRSGRPTQPVLALGVLLGWWTDEVSDKVVKGIETTWKDAFGVTLNGETVVSSRANAMAFHITAVRDRLSRSALPEIPESAFEEVRLSQSAGAIAGWGIKEQARDIAERLAWEPDKTYWKRVKADAEDQIDAILDPLGKPGTPARTLAHQNDPQVKFWQTIRAQAVERLTEDEGVWKTRATRIARTEATAAWNAGALAALAAEGRTHKRWLASHDQRTRHTHREADNQVVPLGKPFRVGESLLMMPGDPSGPPHEVINCRCTVLGADAQVLTASGIFDLDSILAAGTNQGWRDQLRIPKGNGRRSGRWTFTPWKHLDDLANLLNAVGGEDPRAGEARARVKEALDTLSPFDSANLDVHDQSFTDATKQVSNIVGQIEPIGDESFDDALQVAKEGILEFAETDWSLFDEETDIDVPMLGRANKNVWEGDLPSDTPVNPDLPQMTSQELADELLKIKNHPVAPSPTARRKRAAYLKELNDRRDRDEQANVNLPEPTDLDQPEPTDIDAPDQPAPSVGLPDLANSDLENAELIDAPVSAMGVDLRAEVIASLKEAEDTTQDGILRRNAYQRAASDVREYAQSLTGESRTAWEKWADSLIEKSNQLDYDTPRQPSNTGALSAERQAEYDGVLEFYKNRIEQAGKKSPGAAREALRNLLMNLRNHHQVEMEGYREEGLAPPPSIFETIFLDMAGSLQDMNVGDWSAAEFRFQKETYNLAPEHKRWATLLPAIKNLPTSIWSEMEWSDYSDRAAQLEKVLSASQEDALKGLLDFKEFWLKEHEARPELHWSVEMCISGLRQGIRASDPDRTEANFSLLTAVLENAGPAWAPFIPVFHAYRNTVLPDLRAQAQAIEDTIRAKYGSLDPDQSSSLSAIAAIGAYFRVRRDNQNNNCVLASTAFELRRRGIDGLPKTAKKGKASRVAHSSWFMMGSDTGDLVPDLRGRQKKAKYERTRDFVLKTHPPGARGTISASWRGRSSGHIWNWEIDSQGEVTFYDAQTNEVIDRDNNTWHEMGTDRVHIQRLDNKPLKANVEVILAPPEFSARNQSFLEFAERYEALRRDRRRLHNEWFKYYNIRGVAEDPKLSAAKKKAYDEWQAVSLELSTLSTTEEFKAFQEFGRSFPDLDPDKYTL